MSVQFPLNTCSATSLAQYLPFQGTVHVSDSTFRFSRRYDFLEEISESDSSSNIGTLDCVHDYYDEYHRTSQILQKFKTPI